MAAQPLGCETGPESPGGHHWTGNRSGGKYGVWSLNTYPETSEYLPELCSFLSMSPADLGRKAINYIGWLFYRCPE